MFLRFKHRISCLRTYPHFLGSFLLEGRYRKKPHLKDTEQVSPGVWDRVHKKELREEVEKINRKIYKVQDRVQRFINYVEKRNREILEKMSPGEALAALEAEEMGCLKWYECLPPGIGYQLAADKTGVKFWVGGWTGNVHSGAEYTPQAKKPVKTRMVAKRI